MTFHCPWLYCYENDNLILRAQSITTECKKCLVKVKYLEKYTSDEKKKKLIIREKMFFS